MHLLISIWHHRNQAQTKVQKKCKKIHIYVKKFIVTLLE